MTLLALCIASLLVGSALGAAWRRAETREWREHAYDAFTGWARTLDQLMEER